MKFVRSNLNLFYEKKCELVQKPQRKKFLKVVREIKEHNKKLDFAKRETNFAVVSY